MPMLQRLPETPVQREFTQCFKGLRQQGRVLPGEFHMTENLSSGHFPAMGQRVKRALAARLASPGAILGGESLYWVDGGVLYRDGEATPLTGLAEGEKQLVSMGAYVCVFPDKCYYNSEDETDFGSMEARYSSAGDVSIFPCSLEGAELSVPEASPDAPDAPENGRLWLDSSSLRPVLRQWSEAQSSWVELDSVYTKLSFISSGELPRLFKRLDGVRVSGCCAEELNGSRIIYGVGCEEGGRDYILLQGFAAATVQTEGSIVIERICPELDFVCQCGNRLWGCRRGGGLNELYCCALGDFKNWEQYLGLSTDSWRASVGVDGDWTGAAAYMDSPCFFKATGICRISVSSMGAHRVSFMGCEGLEAGSHRSAAVVAGALYYKGAQAVYRWQGGYPEEVSAAINLQGYKNAAAGVWGGLYYLSCQDADGRRQLLVYDSKRDIWLREDSLPVTAFAAVGQELYALAGRELWALRGSVGEKEEYISWSAESGVMGCRLPGQKYLSRFILRLEMEEGAELRLYLRYDSGEDWLLQGRVMRRGRGSVLLPVRPRRCDHLEMRLEGRGEVRLLSLCRVLETGGDI